jgi:cell division septum initiation protein DivIVA
MSVHTGSSDRVIPASSAHPFGCYPTHASAGCDDLGVSRHGNIQALGDGIATERTFDLALRGYSRREVDRYVNLLESQIAVLSSDRQDNESQLRNLSAQLHRAQIELIELRRRPSADNVSFRHLGPRAEQILTLAEEQAAVIRAEACDDMTDERNEVHRLFVDAKQRAEAIMREAEAEVAHLRATVNREMALHKENLTAELVRRENRAEQLRQDAQHVLAKAEQEATSITEAAASEAERLRNEGSAQAKALRSKAEEEATALGAAAEQYAQQTRTSAEQHAQQTRTAAEKSASEVVLQAERHATQIRTGAEQHVARLHNTAQKAAAQVQKDAERAAAEALNSARHEISRLRAEATMPKDGVPKDSVPGDTAPNDSVPEGGMPEDVRDQSSSGTHSALLRHRTPPNPAGAQKQTSPSDAERTSDDPPVKNTDAN